MRLFRVSPFDASRSRQMSTRRRHCQTQWSLVVCVVVWVTTFLSFARGESGSNETCDDAPAEAFEELGLGITSCVDIVDAELCNVLNESVVEMLCSYSCGICNPSAEECMDANSTVIAEQPRISDVGSSCQEIAMAGGCLTHASVAMILCPESCASPDCPLACTDKDDWVANVTAINGDDCTSAALQGACSAFPAIMNTLCPISCEFGCGAVEEEEPAQIYCVCNGEVLEADENGLPPEAEECVPASDNEDGGDSESEEDSNEESTVGEEIVDTISDLLTEKLETSGILEFVMTAVTYVTMFYAFHQKTRAILVDTRHDQIKFAKRKSIRKSVSESNRLANSIGGGRIELYSDIEDMEELDNDTLGQGNCGSVDKRPNRNLSSGTKAKKVDKEEKNSTEGEVEEAEEDGKDCKEGEDGGKDQEEEEEEEEERNMFVDGIMLILNPFISLVLRVLKLIHHFVYVYIARKDWSNLCLYVRIMGRTKFSNDLINTMISLFDINVEEQQDKAANALTECFERSVCLKSLNKLRKFVQNQRNEEEDGNNEEEDQSCIGKVTAFLERFKSVAETAKSNTHFTKSGAAKIVPHEGPTDTNEALTDTKSGDRVSKALDGLIDYTERGINVMNNANLNEIKSGVSDGVRNRVEGD